LDVGGGDKCAEFDAARFDISTEVEKGLS